MRCFVGIELDAPVREALVAAGRTLRVADEHLRGEKWVAPENLHLTLVFLGDVADETAAPLANALGEIVPSVAAFELPFSGIRAVPSPSRMRMLWAAYADPERACEQLAAKAAGIAETFGVEIEDRPFKAHVTLARARTPRRLSARGGDALAAASAAVPPLLSVRSTTLFASTLTRSGPEYRTLGRWSLDE